MTLVIDKETGKKMYPVGKMMRYQHVFYNYNDRCFNQMIDSDHEADACDRFDESERFLDIATTNVYNGMIFALYEDYKKMKDIIAAYVCRHDGKI